MLTPNDLNQIREVMKEEIQGTVPKIVEDIIQGTVPKIVENIIQGSVPKIVEDIIQGTVPKIVHGIVQDTVPGIVHKIVHSIVDDAKKELKLEIKKSILREHKKTRALVNMVIGDYDTRLINQRKRLERIEAHLDLPRIQN